MKRRWLTLLIGAGLVGGVVGLVSAVGKQLTLAAVLIALLVAFAKFNEIAGRVIGATIVGAFVLMGVNVALDNLFDFPEWWIVPGLVLAIAVFGVAAGWYMRGSEEPWVLKIPPPRGTMLRFPLGRGSRWGAWTTSVAAFALAVFLIVDVPIIVERKHPEGAILAGVAAAALPIGLGAWCQLKNEPLVRRLAGFAAPFVGLVLLGAAPIVVQQSKDRARPVAAVHQVPSRVDVRIVTDGSSHAKPPDAPPDPALGGFDVHYSVGYADGNGVRWTLVDDPDRQKALAVAAQGRTARPTPDTPLRRKDADGVLVLLVDGTPPVIDGSPADLPGARAVRGEVGRWRRVAHAAREPKMPTFALLQANGRHGRARLDSWRLFTRTGGVVSLQQLGRRAATDAGLALAIGAPTAEADLALAVEHRPVLLFDKDEPVPVPLSVEWLFSQDDVMVCRDRGVAKSRCDTTHNPVDLVSSADYHLAINFPDSDVLRSIARSVRPPAPEPQRSVTDNAAGAPAASVPVPAAAPATAAAPGTPQTAIYVHAVPVERGSQSLLYLDYWWYLPDNPVKVGLKAFCGAGLVIPGITCHNHKSDWEGMTVVIDRTTKPVVNSVQYAEHNDVVAIPWKVLRRRWNTTPQLRALRDAADNGRQRPLAFIASGTHSSYPLPCPPHCDQIAHKGRGDDPRRGTLQWLGNFTNQCGRTSCLHRLPTTAGGLQPALWNAFAGPWGREQCVLTYYCDSAESPKAPGKQPRYIHPTRCTGKVDDEWTFKPEPCEE